MHELCESHYLQIFLPGSAQSARIPMTATSMSPGPCLTCYLTRKGRPRAAAAAFDVGPALRHKPTIVQATSSSSSAADATQPRQLQQEQQPSLEVLATDGRYVVTPFDHDRAEEVAAITALQTAAFAKPPTGIAPWDAFERSVFAAEARSEHGHGCPMSSPILVAAATSDHRTLASAHYGACRCSARCVTS